METLLQETTPQGGSELGESIREPGRSSQSPPLGSEPPSPSDDRAEKKKTEWFEQAKTLLEIGGTGGAFMAAGYVAETAHDDLLGVNFPISRTLTDYALTGGRFVIESVARLWIHPWISILGLSVIAVALALGTRLNIASEQRRVRVQAWGFLALLMLFAWKAYRLDVPYIKMEGVLRRSPISDAEKARHTWLSFRQEDIWRKLVCTHIASEKDKWTAVLDRQFPDCASRLEGCAAFSASQFRDLLLPLSPHNCFAIEQEYVINVYSTGFLLLVTILLVRSAPPAEKARRSLAGDCRAALRVLMLFVAVGSTVTIPYIYGKAIESTVLPAGRICFDSTDFSGQPKIEIANALIVWADDKFVTVYRTDSFEFLHLSRARVRYVSASSASDIIRTYALWYCQPQRSMEGGQ